ncbi:MAG: FHA domain-containing protein [Dactylosporangium sp.]|nr:FHA domain-containing protein [Dactylosporangium sp.]NNJ61192.1 FHA domain-containing protein [Dactylosporangium sp.]
MTDALIITLPAGEHRLVPEHGTVVVGRDPLCPMVIDDDRVSREHLAIGYVNGRWLLRDLGSSNGTFASTGQITELDIVEPCLVRLGDAGAGPGIVLRPEAAPGAHREASGHTGAALAGPDPGDPARGGPAGSASQIPGRMPSAVHRALDRIRVGRAPDNTIVLDDLLVSRYHAELVRGAGAYQVVDLGSNNGTFVNGQRADRVTLRPGDRVSFGHHQMVFDGSELREYVDTGRVSLKVEGLTVEVSGGRQLLDRVSFELGECSLLAVVGPSGAGKSTLLGALTGIRPASSGAVWYEGRDLYTEYDDLRHRIGLVPQDDILHSQLTVRRALRYAAALRFGSDVTRAERDARIDEVLDQLGLTAHAQQRIDTLSGGQRKRTSVALELLTEPSLLFLDEPTSGLDPGLDRDVMVGLRDLANRGRTVVVVTHSPLHLNVCDRVLVLGRGGKVAYLGHPSQLLTFFGASGYADVFTAVAQDPDVWAKRFAATVTPASAAPAVPGRVLATSPPPRKGRWRQLAILTRRMVAVTGADRLYAALSLGLPLGLALLLHVIPGADGLGRPGGVIPRTAEAAQLLVVLLIGAVFVGLAGGIREFVREGAIYRRERAVGLSPSAYLGSKLLVFGLLNLVQAALFVIAGLMGRPGPGEALLLGQPMLELIGAVWLTAVVSTLLGLLVSAFVSTNEQTMPVLVGLVMAQLVLCGGLFDIVGRGGIEQLSWIAPARWGYAASAATVDLRSIMLEPPADALWAHTAGAWGWAMGVLAFQGLVMVIATRLALRRHEPGRT